MLEEFLYTRELPFSKLTLSLGKQGTLLHVIIEQYFSSKKIPDCEQLNKFSHLSSDIERNLIANIPIKYSKKSQLIAKDTTLINDLVTTIRCEYS